MTDLAHEVWEAPGTFEFGLPNPRSDALRAQIEPDACLRHVIFASSYVAGMKAYYQWQGWGDYAAPDGFEDVPYTAEQLEQQKTWRPEYYPEG